MKTAFIFSEEFDRVQAYEGYPWAFARSRATYDLCRHYKLLDGANTTVVAPRLASRKELEVFHAKSYLDVLERANNGVFEESMLFKGIGTLECPVYKGCYDYHALACGATLLAADLVEKGEAKVVFSPTGGLHHAGPDFAAGFCYLNDINVALHPLVDKGLRIFYVDIDAHHGDQVQEAWYKDNRVFTLSLHESGHTLFPWTTGFETEIGEGAGKGFNVNVPLPPDTDDELFTWIFNRVFPPLVTAFKPDIVMGVIAVDALHQDPQTHLRLTNLGYCDAVKLIARHSEKLIALGCGGYNLDNIARGWTLAWAILNGIPIEDETEALFGGQFWGDGIISLKDRPLFIEEETRKKTRQEGERIVSYIEKTIFPIHHIGV
jgi:acetoin utilization protein AcuC